MFIIFKITRIPFSNNSFTLFALYTNTLFELSTYEYLWVFNTKWNTSLTEFYFKDLKNKIQDKGGYSFIECVETDFGMVTSEYPSNSEILQSVIKKQDWRNTKWNRWWENTV